MRAFLLIISVSLLAACASDPMMQTGANAQISYDGLHKVDNTRMKDTWAKQDLDLNGYTKVLIVSAGIEYRSVRPVNRSSYARSRSSEFPLSEKQKRKLEISAREAFLEELKNTEKFELVAEPGADVLSLSVALLDVVSSVPPESIGSRTDFYLKELGSATLVLELRDSQSGEIFVRTIDRRKAESAFIRESNPVTNMAEAKRSFRRWARILREGLDKAYNLKL